MSDMPEISGIHHVTLSVGDLERSLEWYARVLGFEVRGQLAQDDMRKALMFREGLFLTVVEHTRTASNDPFDERHIGLDHLAFAVADRVALDAWVIHLDAENVIHSNITTASMGELVAFRDPDNIALEFYTVNS